MKYYEELGAVAQPIIDSTNALMMELNTANVKPTSDMVDKMIAFRNKLNRAKVFVMLDIDDDAECESSQGDAPGPVALSFSVAVPTLF